MPPAKGSKRVTKTRKPVTLSAMQTGSVEPTLMGRYRRTRGERDEQQKAFDAMVDLAWREWIDAGKPEDWNEQPGTFFTVPADELETAQYLVYRAGRYYHLKIRFGRVETEVGEDGATYATAVFTATDFPAGESEPPDEDDDNDGYATASDVRDVAQQTGLTPEEASRL